MVETMNIELIWNIISLIGQLIMMTVGFIVIMKWGITLLIQTIDRGFK